MGFKRLVALVAVARLGPAEDNPMLQELTFHIKDTRFKGTEPKVPVSGQGRPE